MTRFLMTALVEAAQHLARRLERLGYDVTL
jgi:hypothetical protein